MLREKPRKPKEARSKERTDNAWPTPEPPNRGARPWGSAMAEPCRRRGSAIPWPSPCDEQGTPFWVPDSAFRRYPSMFRGVWRVKRPLNPIKQGPLCPYRREIHNGSRIMFIRLRCFEKSPEDQGNTLKRANRRHLADPRAPNRGAWPWGSAMAEPCRRR